MNNQSPLSPLGSFLEQKNKGRARVKIAVFFVLAIHGVGLLALLLQGCRKDESGTKTDQPNATAAAQQQLETTNPVAPENPGAPPGNTAANAQPNVADTNNAAVPAIGGTDYTIAKGDTFSTIATHFHVSVTAIADANPGVDAKRLQIGKKLHIPPQPLPTAPGPGNGPATVDTQTGEKLYTVKSGDTLITIARANGTTVKAIRSTNPSLTTDRIIVGQKLKLPAKAVETAASNAPATR